MPLSDGAETFMVGAVLSTLKLDDGELSLAKFPRVSVAVPEETVMPTVPSPRHPEIVMVLASPVPEIALVVHAAPDWLRITSFSERDIEV